MDFSAQLDALQTNVAEAKAAVTTAASESRDQLRQRIDQAQAEVALGVEDVKQHADAAGASARSKWAQMKADAAAKADDIKAKIDERNAKLDANIAADDAAWAEEEAFAAIDYAGWAVDNMRLAVLDAIDARAYADERAKATSG